MKCFQVTVNGVKVCTAGIGDSGVLTSILSLVKRNDSETLDLRVGGLAHRQGDMTEHLEWFRKDLDVGDKITIKIVEASECDEAGSKEITYDRCSFCSRKQADVSKIIAGPAVFICTECVGDCAVALAKGAPTGNITTIIEKAAEDRCSFCGKQPADVEGIVGVPEARICNKCLKICGEILAQDELREDGSF